MHKSNMSNSARENCNDYRLYEGNVLEEQKENGKRLLDLRVMKLNKWYVPKSYTLEQAPADTIVLGYFDALEVKEVTNDSKLHPFTAGYEKLASWKREQREQEKKQGNRKDELNLVDFSSQEQLLFLNLCRDGEPENGTQFSKTVVEKFWEKEDRVCPYLFLSMIHISSGGMEKALKKIHKVFEKDYLSYISYDYCDIVLFARNRQIPKFMAEIRGLFQSDEEDISRNETIFDTFSMVSFYPPRIAEESQDGDSGKKNPTLLESSRHPDTACVSEKVYWAGAKAWKEWLEKHNETEEVFQATVNLSIRDYGTFEEWYKNEQEEGRMPADKYHMFGRNDVSITQCRADINWLMEMMKALHLKQNQKMFWTFETFIKVSDLSGQKAVLSADSRHLEETYQKVVDNLEAKIRDLEDAIANSALSDQEKDRYIQPVYEVMHCICSIVKNSFAEEFVCCVYDSFRHFVSYMAQQFGHIVEGKPTTEQKHKQTHEQKEAIAKSYDRYFGALNTLVNSTMHNERQFVQATAFNAVFYSVPPKILAFYNAYIHLIEKILSDATELEAKPYTFLIYPSFSPLISLGRLSLDDEPPCDRILSVCISERNLYDIRAVLYQMVHELAHYMGDSLRCRSSVRKECIRRTLLCCAMAMCRVEEEDYFLLKCFFCENEENKLDYLENFDKQSLIYILKLDEPEKFIDFAKVYYQERFQEMKSEEGFHDAMLDKLGIKGADQKAYIQNYTLQYANIKYNAIRSNWNDMQKEKLKATFGYIVKQVKSAYRECYADLQMLLVLGMRGEDYLKTFFNHHEVSVRHVLESREDFMRICAMFRLMTDCGLWDEPGKEDEPESANDDQKRYRAIYQYIRKYNEQVKAYENGKKDMVIQKERDTDEKQKSVTEIVHTLKDALEFQNGICLDECLPKELDEEKEMQIPEPLYAVAADLYRYLLEVMELSLKAYFAPVTDGSLAESKRNQIYHLRKLVRNVLAFEDAMQVFSRMEEEVNAYKSNLNG